MLSIRQIILRHEPKTDTPANDRHSDVLLPVGESEAVALVLIVDDDVIVGVMVELSDKDGVPLAEAP